MRLVIVSGLSGSGKTVALHALEDAGYLCIDNLPLGLIEPLFAEIDAARDADDPSTAVSNRQHKAFGDRIAVGVDVRSGLSSLRRYPDVIEFLRARGCELQTIFLNASDAILLRRFHHTRRSHPLAQEGTVLLEAIANEREWLRYIAAHADLQIDTDALSMHALAQRIREYIIDHDTRRLALTFQSFGFKYGTPVDSDFVFDVRHLPNPHYEPGLAEQTGHDPAVIEFLERHDDVDAMFDSIQTFLERWSPAFLRDHRSYLTVSIGCTGGRHRSVYLAERLFRSWQDHPRIAASVRHRESLDHSASDMVIPETAR